MNFFVLRKLRSHDHSSALREKSPTLQFEPLSPARPYTTRPSGIRVVGPKVDKSTGSVGSYEG